MYTHCHSAVQTTVYNNRVATGQGKVREIQGQGKVRKFYNLSGKFGILVKVREIKEKSEKFNKIYI